MNNLIKHPVIQKYENRIKKIRFKKKKFILIDENDLTREYVFIVLENTKTNRFKVSAYSSFLFEKGMLINKYKTREEYAKIIVLFLNFIFFDMYEHWKLKDIENLKIEHGDYFLSQYAFGKLGKSEKSRETVQLAEVRLKAFYKWLVSKCNMKYISHSDFERTLFSFEYPSYVSPQRIKHISSKLFVEILKICDDYPNYRKLKLAFCLQAFAGLRGGEVCNVSLDKLQYSYTYHELSFFSVDLREKTRLRKDYKSVGGIKKPRIQAVHPMFLPYFRLIFEEHLELIKNSENPFGAIFLNRDQEAMMESSYNFHFKNIINILINRLIERGDSSSIGEAYKLMSGKINKHVFRHFYTQTIAETEITPNQLAFWRGDSNIDSSITYLTQNPEIDNKIKQIQQSIFTELSKKGE
ncbi:hypothetical protein VO178_02470 [Lysinibacillus fusiformis]|uniref:hypothetical protein n=1 Tax=Lysinibacillus fusiformis TaxID=28031 RepID=UPI002D76E9DE|nr:hypothetical protein [Lysinibacillus fusiformis]WRS98599.1 hypothetical protein VO178_02470 [Lysinibacillus fusiformis]